jgi:hypothetical protein
VTLQVVLPAVAARAVVAVEPEVVVADHFRFRRIQQRLFRIGLVLGSIFINMGPML